MIRNLPSGEKATPSANVESYLETASILVNKEKALPGRYQTSRMYAEAIRMPPRRDDVVADSCAACLLQRGRFCPNI
jgi:hypothetical protein